MNVLCLTVALALCWVSGVVTEDSCAAYRELHPKHSMCQTDIGTTLSLTESDIVNIVFNHNQMRSGALKEYAANMEEMVWDDDLAEVASKWARQCKRSSEKNNMRRHVLSLEDIDIGQNIHKFKAGSIKPISKVVLEWEKPKVNFTYGAIITQDQADALLPYAQIIHAPTSRIGCGWASCSKNEVFVCNYAPLLNNDPASVSKPYDSSSLPCSSCNSVCDDYGFLCVCNGEICGAGEIRSFDATGCQCS